MYVLGIETSCDESGVALVKNGREILSNKVASQIEIHAPFKGVVPELASRAHVEILPILVKEAVKESGLSSDAIDAIAVTYGPGLIGSLLVGLNYAKGLALSLKKPLVAVCHVEAHLYAAQMSAKDLSFPAIGLVASGGHSSLYLMKEPFSYKLCGHSVDDAAGEAFDKVAILLGLGYPGGPLIEKLALLGNKDRFQLKVGQIKERPFDFSFSGIKTGVLNLVKKNEPLSEETKADIAACFQSSVLEDLVRKTLLAAKEHLAKSIIVGGGVSQNQALRDLFSSSSHLPLYFATRDLCMDNGAMIAALGYHLALRGNGVDLCSLEANSRLSL